MSRYLAQGIEGLKITPGCGRKPAYAPACPNADTAKEALHILRQLPANYQPPGTRCKLSSLLEICGWLRVTRLPGLSQWRDRLDISYKRVRNHLHSPDKDYVAKLSAVERTWRQF